MDIRPETAVRGFISRTPTLKRLPTEVLLLITQLGQKQYRREEDGTFTHIDANYVEMVMLGERAETAADQFMKGDDVVALGEMRPRTYEHRGQKHERIQFRVSRLLFDTTRPRYTVARTPRLLTPDGLFRAASPSLDPRAVPGTPPPMLKR